MKKSLLPFIFCSLSVQLYSQKVWTLEHCLSHAREHNLSIKQAYLTSEISKKTLFQSKMNLLPSVNGSASDNTNFGRNIDPVTNEITVDRIRNNNFGISSSVTLFSGFQNINTIRKNNFDYLASRYDAQKVANDISVNIVTAYLQLLYNQDLILVSQQKVDISDLQVQRVRQKVDLGSLPRGDLLNTEAQKAQEELQLISAQNQSDLAMLNLKQLLDIPADEFFEVATLTVDPPSIFQYMNTSEVYQQALQNMPEVQSAALRLQSTERALAIAQASRSPRLSLSASIGTAYSSASQRLVYDSLFLPPIPTYVDFPFEDQLNENLNQSISLSLSIPIFNGWRANTNISQAKINVIKLQYTLQETQNNLRKIIEQAHNDALAAHKKFLAAKKTVEFQSESFQYSEEKYNLQLITSYEYNNAKNILFTAQTDLLQAKYDYMFKIKMLDFYLGNPLTF
ncbi:MAG: TolC family protein [Bacteroidota bacterium]|nr:TolC family protein [Bacteroidota bacterium]